MADVASNALLNTGDEPSTETDPQTLSADAAVPQSSTPDPSHAKQESESEPPEEESWKKRLWFVRLPAPEQVPAGHLQAQVDSLKEQVKLLNASAQVKRLERDQIKLLQASREKVREYAAKAGTLAAARQVMTGVQDELRSLEAERRVLNDERQAQSKIVEKYWAEQQGLDGEVENIMKERQRIKEQQDEVYAELRQHQQDQRSRSGAYSANRSFSQKVRQVLRAGHLQQAREMCDHQMDESFAKLGSDAEFRTEYYALWEQNRPNREGPAVANAAKQGDAGAVQDRARSKLKAQDIVTRALEHARQEVIKSRSDGNLAGGASQSTGTTVPLPAAGDQTTGDDTTVGNGTTHAKAPIQKSVRPKAKVVKAAPPPASANGHAAQHIPEPQFELPDYLQKSETPVDERALRVQARQHSMAAAREAEARKQKRAQDKERKRVQEKERKEAKAKAALVPKEVAPEAERTLAYSHA
ncbi:hypothetical protein WJX73_007015 [Symbiochloris irregularis]|uniref:Uncharacterized protein n=1 Tax=Symbiochloris irregularis TaxID=706552 RepID=A0AAW1PIZ8_9CHLO